MPKRVVFTTILAAFIVFSFTTPARAELVRLYPEDFGMFQPELLGTLNLLLGELQDLQIPIYEDYLIDDFVCAYLGVTFEADLFFDVDQSGFSLFWDTSGENDLVFQSVFQEWSVVGDVDFVGEDCLGFIDFEIGLLDGDIGSSPNTVDMVVIPYWNTETMLLELHHKEHEGSPMTLVALENFHLDLGLPWPLDEMLEPFLETWAYDEIRDYVMEGLVGTNGLLFAAVRETMAGLYDLHKTCGCTITTGAMSPRRGIGLDQVLINAGIYLIPALFAAGLKRRRKK